MSFFDKLVDEALVNQPTLSTLRVVVEKELLHHDILRILSEAGLLQDLTFIGGTCLRMCYGSNRLSEDLDFTGGRDFTRDQLHNMGSILSHTLNEKYELPVEVSEPVRETGNVSTWKLKVKTRPKRKDLPEQRINIDICRVTSYEIKPMMLLNPYGVDMGTTGLIIKSQSREEIFSNKLLAFAGRPNRIKHRDLWDMSWLHQCAIMPNMDLILDKITERSYDRAVFMTLFSKRAKSLDEKMRHNFHREMQRFLPSSLAKQTIDNIDFWPALVNIINELGIQIEKALMG